MWLTKHYKSLLNYETSGRDLGFAFPSLGGFAYIEGMVIRCLETLESGNQISPRPATAIHKIFLVCNYFFGITGV